MKNAVEQIRCRFVSLVFLAWWAPVLLADASEPPAEVGAIDHVAYVTPNLSADTAIIAKHLGLTPTAGGRHVNLGSANNLVSLGGRQYLEIVGPSEEREEETELTRFMLAQEGPAILGFAVETTDIDALIERLTEAGLEVVESPPESRRTPSGVLLSWRGLFVTGHDYAGFVPFFLDWGDSPHPGTTSVQGATMSLTIAHPEPEGLRELYDKLGVRVPVTYSNRSAILLEIRNGDRSILLQGSGEGLESIADEGDHDG